MPELLNPPGMIIMLVAVIVLQALSIGFLWLNMNFFRSHRKKYDSLLSGLGNETAMGKPGRIIVPIYIVATLVSSAIIILLFMFQPHLV